MHHYGYWDGGHSAGWILVNGAFWIILVAAIIAATMFWLRRSQTDDRSDSGRTAIDILDRRYARGEIDREDYLQRKRDLLDAQADQEENQVGA